MGEGFLAVWGFVAPILGGLGAVLLVLGIIGVVGFIILMLLCGIGVLD